MHLLIIFLNTSKGGVMLKGVNKSVIEINNTDNDYIEKAILFVKPEKQDANISVINHKAKKYLDSLKQVKGVGKNSRFYMPYYMPLFLGSVLGAAVCFIFMNFL